MVTFAGAVQFINDALWWLVVIAYFVRWIGEEEREGEDEQ